MPTGAVGSFPLEGTTFELDFTTDENLPSSLPSTPPRHHRTSSISDSPACSINGGSNDSAAGGATSSSSGLLNPAGSSLHGGSSNSSNNGSSSGSDAGATTGGGGIAGSRQVAFGGLSMMPLELPDFASMLPSESSFTESSVDDAAAPTPHTPVVLSVFEGEGIKVSCGECVVNLDKDSSFYSQLGTGSYATTTAPCVPFRCGVSPVQHCADRLVCNGCLSDVFASQGSSRLWIRQPHIRHEG